MEGGRVPLIGILNTPSMRLAFYMYGRIYIHNKNDLFKFYTK